MPIELCAGGRGSAARELDSAAPRVEVAAIAMGGVAAEARVSRFGGRGAAEEIHLVVTPTGEGGFAAQLAEVVAGYRKALAAVRIEPETAVFRRFFCSDPVNQAAALGAEPIANREAPDVPCAISWVGQAPVPGGKVALWAYHIREAGAEVEKRLERGALTMRRGGLTHQWATGIVAPEGKDSHEQTRLAFERYEGALGREGLTLANDTMRTWLFVQHVDANYGGLVAARREFFAERGLTAATHTIASSGIEGGNADVRATVAMDAYAVGGLGAGQVQYLSAPDHLSPTELYGVTFERGTSITYRDRKHVLISGTASIDHEGRIMHPGDIGRQLDRTLENIGALLGRAGGTFRDLCSAIVYVRDPSDHAVASRRVREALGDLPMVVVLAPVCRPGWLIEIEAMAVVPAAAPEMQEF